MILKKHLEFWYQRLPARTGWKSLGAAKSTICRYSLWRICSENSQKWLNGWVQFRKNIDLPRISHVNFYNEIRILSAICALTTRRVTLPPPPPLFWINRKCQRCTPSTNLSNSWALFSYGAKPATSLIRDFTCMRTLPTHWKKINIRGKY